jgi:uncharacterized protein
MAEKGIDSTTLKVVRYFAKRLAETGVDVTCIVVFGSRLTGAAREDSDIDMIVVSKDFHKKNIMKRAALVRTAYADTINEFMIPIDLVMESPDEFNPDFGKVVYAA